LRPLRLRKCFGLIHGSVALFETLSLSLDSSHHPP
jgi:hypothetical protein